MDANTKLEKAKVALLCMERFPWEQGAASQAFLELEEFDIAYLMARDAANRQTLEGRLGAAFFRDEVALFGDETTSLDSGANGVAVLYFAKKKNDDYLMQAAKRQEDWFLKNAPRSESGLLYQVLKKPQFWVDSMFMLLPFLTECCRYDFAIEQMRGFRNTLMHPEKKLYSHVYDDETKSFITPDFWGVGNGWAIVAITKMLRGWPRDRADEIQELTRYFNELLGGLLNYQLENGLFHNIIDDKNSFVEANLAQMVAFSIYTAVLEGFLSDDYLKIADKIRAAVLERVDENGIVQGVCGSPTFTEPGYAPEGQAFFLHMEAAARKMR